MSITIVIAEDDTVSRNLLKITLQEFGYDLIEACNGEEALAKVLSLKPDLLLLDIMMPLKNGWEVCQAIRENDEVKELPIFMISAKHSVKDMELAKKYNVKGYIIKPFHVKRLQEKIERVLK